MQIERLRINNFRGIPELDLEPEGDNLCLIGPNGSGKSSIIEAVDFLLTGTIQDLTGEGTGDISLRRHGAYLRGDPDETWVEGTFSADGADPVTIKRYLSDRQSLESDGEIPTAVERLMGSAEKGQHYLSRREILNFIVARKQSRSEQLRTLLDLSTIKEKRLELQGAANGLDEEASKLERERENRRERLVEPFDEADSIGDVLSEVNALRDELDGEPLEELSVETPFRTGLESPTDRASANPLQSSRTRELLETIRDWFEGDAAEFWTEYGTVLERVEEVRENEQALRDLEALDLIQKGQQFVDDETTSCPLCRTSWDPDELQSLLDRRESQAEEAKELREDINEARDEALSKLTNVRTAIESLIDILEQHEEYGTSQLGEFQERLDDLETQLANELLDQVPLEDNSPDEREKLLEPEEVDTELERLESRAEELPELDRLQAAWDDLHSAYEIFQEYKNLQEQAAGMRRAADEMESVRDAFVSARDEILTDTYEAISDRFEEFYTTLHHDEDEFAPDMEPTETGLDIKVGFHGEGKHPPHALHSEGHQDSMGLCLFLALCDFLDEEELSLVMLDDVVMSIDAEHRRPLARLLKEDISSRFQLLITTHDELWYRHLKTEGVVSSRNTVKFTSWSLANGPVRVDDLADGWDRIDALLEEGDVAGAAHRLRHTSEWFLREACHQLNAEVQFKADGLWSLGDFMGPALSKFKSLLKDAKRAEQSWGNDIGDVSTLDDQRSEVFRRLNMEQGAINPNVHFNENEWATFTPAEMREVVEVFHDLYELFWCSNCESCVRVSEQDHREVSIRCSCGQHANWTLEEQS